MPPLPPAVPPLSQDALEDMRHRRYVFAEGSTLHVWYPAMLEHMQREPSPARLHLVFPLCSLMVGCSSHGVNSGTTWFGFPLKDCAEAPINGTVELQPSPSGNGSMLMHSMRAAFTAGFTLHIGFFLGGATAE